MSQQLIALLPLLVALATATLALAADAWMSRFVAIVIASTGLLAAAIMSAASVGDSWQALGFVAFGTGYSALQTVILASAGFAVLGGSSELQRHPRGGQLAALAVLIAGAAAGVAVSFDLVAMLILLEIGAVAAYAFVALGERPGSPEAAVKYFVQGSIATTFFVLGIGALIGVYGGSASLEQILGAGEFLYDTPALVGMGLVVSALAFKAGAFPFHSWVPDAYENAPSTGAAILASSAKTGAIAGLLTVTLVLSESLRGSSLPIAAIAAGSIVYGNLAALRQPSYSRMLAYSGIAQVGYALVPVAVGQPQQAAFFLATYSVAIVGAFIGALAIERVRPDWDGSIKGMAGLGAHAPWLAVGIATLVLSLTGIPPLLGFWGKLQAFGVAVYSSRTVTQDGGVILALAVLGLVGSVVSFGYYGAVLRAMYFEAEPTHPEAERIEAVVPGGVDSDALLAEQEASSGIAGRVVGVCAIAVVLGGAVMMLMGQGVLLNLFAYR
jgi:NADH-quinone oxidoreductase subunit N